MYRPRLISRVTSWLTMPPPTPIAPHALIDQAGRAFVASDPGNGPIGYLTAVVRTYATEAVAFHAARTLVDDTGTIDPASDIMVTARAERLVTFANADGVLVGWRTTSRRTGRTAAWAAAIVRHGELVWEITASGRAAVDLADAVVALAANLSERQEAPGDRVRSLLPNTADLPEPMWLDTTFSLAGDEAVLAA
jgi:hypothetical protein